MRLRLKYALPLGQMAATVVFLRLIFLWDVATRRDDMPGKHPAFLLLLYLHLPLMQVLKPLLFGRLPELVLLVAAIGVLWYCVALLIHRHSERGTVFPTDWVALRIAADVLLVTMPACLGLLFIENIKDYPGTYELPRSFEGWSWFLPTYGSLLMWVLGPVFIFGRDLVRCLRRSDPGTANEAEK
jgi:hypothetical protein